MDLLALVIKAISEKMGADIMGPLHQVAMGELFRHIMIEIRIKRKIYFILQVKVKVIGYQIK